MPNPSAVLVLSILLQLATTNPPAAAPAAGTTPDPGRPAATTPTQSVQALAGALSQRSLEALEGLLTADFHFTTTDAEMAARIQIQEIGRERELWIASNLFFGLKRDGKVVIPAADTIVVTADGFRENADPEHPDSTGHFRVVAVSRFSFDIRTPGAMELQALPALQVFHVVRGDAAVLAAGQSADSTRWYVRRWLEDLDALAAALGEVDGDCGQADSAAATRVRTALAPTLPLVIHPLGNPACPTLDLACDLPAAGPALIEVFDAMGRRLTNRELDVAAPGTIKIQAGAGVRLAPGAYWVRLTQAARSSTRMVVVAR
jgi:hypothetical protein